MKTIKTLHEVVTTPVASHETVYILSKSEVSSLAAVQEFVKDYKFLVEHWKSDAVTDNKEAKDCIEQMSQFKAILISKIIDLNI